jgi:hypothetical protein
MISSSKGKDDDFSFPFSSVVILFSHFFFFILFLCEDAAADLFLVRITWIYRTGEKS